MSTRLSSPFACLLAVLMLTSCQEHESMTDTVERGLRTATAQALLLADSVKEQKDRLPRTYEDGQIKTASYKSWISGFFAGTLWLLCEDQPDNRRLLEMAQLYTSRVEPAKEMTDTHDLGFMLHCSFGNGYRLTGYAPYLDVLRQGCRSLSTRYRPEIGVIQSWDASQKWQCPVIIDNMMNLEMLEYVGKATADTVLLDMADTHAQTTLRHHFRPDYSSYHVVSYDTLSREPHFQGTHQGLADTSAWARGQAWALYGYTMMYRETGRPEYLDQAKHVASFIRNHPNLPADKVPYWDFDAPGRADTCRDAAAASVMASALIELSELDPSPEASDHFALAEEMIRSLSSPAYLAEPGTNGGFLLKHSVGNMNKHSEVDVPLTYADYYYVEALLRWKRHKGLLKPEQTAGAQDRAYQVELLTRIARPVLSNLSQGTLHENMPFESLSHSQVRREVSYLEAVGRTICGIAPWLELGPDDSEEGQLRAEFTDMAVRGLRNAVDPESPDYLVFDNRIGQPLVDAAFLAQGMLRAPHALWNNLDSLTRSRLIDEWKRTRTIKPNESNWLLFASTVEVALMEFAGEYDEPRLYRGVNRFLDEWYKGDSWYGDGARHHMDYYNSLVIHPMLTDVLSALRRRGMPRGEDLTQQLTRERRLAATLERLISPEGTYPALGRSITCRVGAFHALAHAVLIGQLPASLPAGQARSALTAVMRRQMEAPGCFDDNGWLTVGFTGHQIGMSESYINTGSQYFCTTAFLPLGLPATHPFWTAPAMPWTNLAAWSGTDVGADHALRD